MNTPEVYHMKGHITACITQYFNFNSDKWIPIQMFPIQMFSLAGMLKNHCELASKYIKYTSLTGLVIYIERPQFSNFPSTCSRVKPVPLSLIGQMHRAVVALATRN